MRLGPTIYGALLLVALLVSYQSWTRDKSVKPSTGKHLVWNQGNAKISKLRYMARYKSVVIERRSEGEQPYLWGTHQSYREGEADKAFDKAVQASKEAADMDAGTEVTEIPRLPPVAPGDDNPREVIFSREFPLNREGTELMDQFVELMALRSLGTLDGEQLEEYELVDSQGYLQVHFDDQSVQTLIIGKKVYGGSDRYALHKGSGEAFVLSRKLIAPLDSGQSMLAVKLAHSFKADDLARIEVDTAAQDKSLERSVEKDEAGKEFERWLDVANPDAGDQTLTNFADRAAKLRPSEFAPELAPEKLVHIATLRYLDSKGEELGFLELYRMTPEMQEQEPNTQIHTQYYLRTELTHSLAKVSRLGAQRVDQDLVQIFGIAEAPPPIDTREPEVPESLRPGEEDPKENEDPTKPRVPTPEEMQRGFNSIRFPDNLPGR